MTKPNKQRAGLQKKVSSVFKDVAIPGHKHTGDPFHSPGSDHEVPSHGAMPDHSLPLPVPESRKVPMPDGLANQTGVQGSGTQETVISTGPKDSDSLVPDEQMRPKDPEGKAVPNLSVTSSASVSSDPQILQTVGDAKSDTVEETHDEEAATRIAKASTPVSIGHQTTQSSLMKKLVQDEATAVGSESVSTEPGVVQNPAAKRHSLSVKPDEQEVAEKLEESAPPVSTDRQASHSSLVKRLAQSEGPENEASLKPGADTPSRKTSAKHEVKKVRQNETSASSTSQIRRSLPDSFVDGDDESGVLNQIKDKLIPSDRDGNTKDKVMMMLVPILAIVMIFMFRHILWKSPGKAKADAKKDKQVVALTGKSDEIGWKIPDPLPAMSRDPMKLPEREDAENSDQSDAPNPGQDTAVSRTQTQTGLLDIRAIVYSDDRASAIVDGRIVYAGSKINDTTIVKINRDSVELERNGQTWVQRVRD